MASRQSIRVIITVCMAAAAVTVAAQQAGPKIAPRDQLTINVWGIEQLSGKFLVDPDGTFEFPHVGRLTAGGLTVRELEAIVSQSLIDGEFLTDPPQVIIELLRTASYRVTVTGAVRIPGEVVFAGELKLFDALVKSGMTGPEAGDEILVVRPAVDPATGAPADDVVLTVNLRELEGGNLATYDIALQDGDRVIVPEAKKVFITGHVRSPGPYTVGSGMNVRQALALAGDITPMGSTRGIRIIRPRPDEPEPEELKNVQLDDPVQPGDTIIIRKRIL